MASKSNTTGTLAGKVALITGASSGIGAATAVMFAKLGAHLALTGRNEANLTKVADECSKGAEPEACKPFLVLGDVTKEDDVKNILDKTIEHFGKLDILVNSAGDAVAGNIETTSLEQFDKIMNVNMRSVYHLTMLAVPYLIETRGNIVNVSSIAGIRPVSSVLAYSLSKAALDQFTRCVAIDLAPKQVRVNGVNAGSIVTPMLRNICPDEEAFDALIEHCKTVHPIGRAGEAEEVASTIAFLASESASNITGTLIPCDGGRHAVCP